MLGKLYSLNIYKISAIVKEGTTLSLPNMGNGKIVNILL